MLAWARFRAGNAEPSMANHALELLDFAESVDPHVDLVHAYRAAVLHVIGERARARASARRALELNPYNDLANEVLDSLA